jgi:hypothetical protein
MDASIFQPLIEAPAERDYVPKSFGDLARTLPKVSLPELVAAGAVLVGAGHAMPCHPEATVQQVGNSCGRLNLHLLERARTRDDLNHLASPVIGGGVAVGRFQQLFLLARHGAFAQPADWARFTWRLLAEQGQLITKNDKVLETPDENLAELTMQANTFVRDQLPTLKALGIV